MNSQYKDCYTVLWPLLYILPLLLARRYTIGTPLLFWPQRPKIGSAVPVEGVWILGTRYLGFKKLNAITHLTQLAGHLLSHSSYLLDWSDLHQAPLRQTTPAAPHVLSRACKVGHLIRQACPPPSFQTQWRLSSAASSNPFCISCCCILAHPHSFVYAA